jgi:uncharacterized RDD family membrane protein YckC
MKDRSNINTDIEKENSHRKIIRRIFAFVHNLLFVFMCYISYLAIFFLFVLLFNLIFKKEMPDCFGIVFLFFNISSPIVIFLVFSFLSSNGRQLPGSKMMKLTVVDTHGKPLTYGKSIVRNLLYLLSIIPLGLGLLWALFDSNSRGWHDLVIGTRVKDSENIDEKISRISIVAFIAGLVCIVVVVAPFAVLVEVISIIEFVLYPLIFLMILLPATFIIGIVSRIKSKKKGKKSFSAKLSTFGIDASLVAGVIFIVIMVAIPSNSMFVNITREKECEETLQKLGEDVDTYIRIKKEFPQELEQMVEDNFINDLPAPFPCYDEQYIYQLKQHKGKKYFIISHPCPEKLFKGGTFSSPKRCTEIKYVQGQGIVVKAKKN